MRIGISALGSKELSRMAEAVRHSLAGLGHDAVLVSDSPYGLGAYDFLVFMTESKGMLGGLLTFVPQKLARQDGLIGKRCLAMVRKSGLRAGYTLRKFMGALEHEGLIVVEGEIFSDADAAVQIARDAPLKRG
ncbi:MAG: hypothetical protein ABFC85_05890 [Rectinema sp.]